MDIQFQGSDTPGNPSGGLCDEYRLRDIASLADVAAAAQSLAAAHPGCTLLFSLDDVAQARYTSGHARMNLALNDVAGLDISGLPAECFEDGEYLGYLSTKAEFFICLHNFRKLTATVTFDDACAHGLTLDDEALEEWVGYQNDPVSLLDQPVSALVVPMVSLMPVVHAPEALAAFPNGYFSCDLGPALNFAVARHFSEVHGYTLMGMGASYLGFMRATPPDAQEARAIAADLCALYNAGDAEGQALARAFTAAVTNRTHLWIRYVE